MEAYMDAHIQLCGNYSEDVLDDFIKNLKKQGYEEIVVLEPSYLFYEFAPLYREAISTYPCQKRWFEGSKKYSLKEYHDFVNMMRKKNFSIRVRFGICVDYFTQHESLIKNVQASYTFDRWVGYIRFLDNIAYDWEESNRMLWDKYNAGYLYCRYYEMLYALITSELFDGIKGFGSLYQLHKMENFSLAHTYKKLITLLALHHMYVEDDVKNQGLSEEFKLLCNAKHIPMLPCTYTTL